MTKKILITGTAGFIGFHMTKKIRKAYPEMEVYGLDSINDYYDPELKLNRLAELGINTGSIEYGKPVKGDGLTFYQAALEDKSLTTKIFKSCGFDYVIHLAAQAGVRYSLQNPYSYIDSNVTGFLNILEGCRHNSVNHLIYASSSSVYGLNETLPFKVGHNVDHPISLYAASKKSNELMAHTYAYLYGIPVTGLRFFTVYGPWGRPDMALFIFTKNILEGKPIEVYNYGKMERDFTYIDDITEAISRLTSLIPTNDPGFSGKNPDPSTSVAPYRVYNIGNNAPVKLLDFIKAIETHTGKEANKKFLPIQPGDVQATYADVTELFEAINFKPKTSVKEGVKAFIDWYREYYKVRISF